MTEANMRFPELRDIQKICDRIERDLARHSKELGEILKTPVLTFPKGIQKKTAKDFDKVYRDPLYFKTARIDRHTEIDILMLADKQELDKHLSWLLEECNKALQETLKSCAVCWILDPARLYIRCSNYEVHLCLSIGIAINPPVHIDLGTKTITPVLADAFKEEPVKKSWWTRLGETVKEYLG